MSENITKVSEVPKISGEQILKISEVKKISGLSTTSIYRAASKGDFPKPIKLGKRSSGWLKSEIDQWLVERVVASRREGR
ncbi:helix-turn-helix transcriptional regulator [Methylophaga thiooxydans]|uniref:helix-turn-helix transcriptional regulator n=1 Tax=Methylophaga thiooxydans TaxID=392484 RepID=UPI00247872AC|nr:AlpA family transcriptional regulator [Methylophaga thiooxydans]